MEKITSIINLKLLDLEKALRELKGKNNTPSRRVLNGKIYLLKEILAEIIKTK